MQKNQIKHILQSPYNRNSWLQFLNFLVGNNADRLRDTLHPQNLSDSFTATTYPIQSIFKIGAFYTSDNQQIPLFEITIKNKIVLERNRIGLNKFVKEVVLKQRGVKAALCIFKYNNTENNVQWRFSFVSKYAASQFFSDAVAKETPAKKYTYIFGTPEEHKTAIICFENFKNSALKVNDFYETFNVEKVSNAFFDGYVERYQLVVDEVSKLDNNFSAIFNGDDKAVRDFAKRLLGRIVFIYFLQRKKWLGATTDNYKDGDEDFLYTLYKQSKCSENGSDYYIQKLTELFFDKLNQKRDNDHYTMPDGTAVKVPYLNGGLFDNSSEPKNYHLIIIPNWVFQNIFDFLNEYNFTINENSPDEHTVAVDPEMLGHIFESLLEDKKQKGTYYTPKEIVQYMTQESLIEYLHTNLADIERTQLENFVKYKEATLNNTQKELINHKLDTVKICDPAIGSGAFPMGMLQEIFSLKEQIAYDLKLDWEPAKVKENIIQNAIYGVDIEQGAVDIARLRFWLSLIVDEEKPKALPNLDYKIVVGNSLVSKLGDDIIDIDWNLNDTSHGLFGADLAKQKGELLKKISAEQKDFFNPDSDKKKLASDIRSLKIDLLINQLELMVKTTQQEAEPKAYSYKDKKKFVAATELYHKTLGWKDCIKQLKKLKDQPDKPLNFFDWKLDFPEVLNKLINPNPGFDIVIANPPYGAKLDEELKTSLKKRYDYLHTRTMDSYNFFIGFGSNLLKNGGILTFIIPSAYLFQVEFEKSRGYFMNNFSPRIFLNLGEKIFDAVVPSCIFSFVKLPNNSKVFIGESKDRKNGLIDFQNGIYLSKHELLEFGGSTIPFNFKNQSIIKKIQEKCINTLSDICLEVNSGITTGHKTAYLIPKTKAEKLKIEENVLFPTLEGRNISPFKINYDDKVIIYADKDFNPLNNPNTINYLKEYYQELANRSEVLQGIKEWYSLGRARGQNLLAAPKIMCRETGDSIVSCFDDYGYYPMNTVICVKLNTNSIDLYKSICSILNSKVINFIFKSISQEEGRTFAKVRPINLRKLPIPNWNSYQISFISSLYDAILKDENLNSEKIDKLNNFIYRLYDLSYEEVKIIDPEFGLSQEEYEKIEIE